MAVRCTFFFKALVRLSIVVLVLLCTSYIMDFTCFLCFLQRLVLRSAGHLSRALLFSCALHLKQNLSMVSPVRLFLVVPGFPLSVSSFPSSDVVSSPQVLLQGKVIFLSSLLLPNLALFSIKVFSCFLNFFFARWKSIWISLTVRFSSRDLWTIRAAEILASFLLLSNLAEPLWVSFHVAIVSNLKRLARCWNVFVS